MTKILIIVLLLLCAGQCIYIFRMKKRERNWLGILRNIRQGTQEKIFIRGKGLTADISYELNGITEANREQVLKFEKADEANRQILTGLSHDVRTPLASLLGYLEALNKGLPTAADETEYITVAYRKANDLKTFIDTLFEWFKLNSNEQQFYFEPADMNELTREIMIEWLPVFEQEHIALSANIADNDLTVSIDKTAYKRILNNLVQNAVQHSGCTQISVAVKDDSESVQVEIVNNGQTIPQEQLPHIFERLYKGDSARSDKGSGLGLAVTKELVAAMHGEISVTSTPGEGTVFTIALPI